MNITVYTMPKCVQCDQTKRMLDREDISYETVDISSNPEAYEKVTALGYKAAPIVIAGEDHWSGFRLERLKGLIAQIHMENAQKAS